MDPFNITVGILGIVSAGLSVATLLKDRIHSYNHAERELVELAHEVDLCTTLVDVLGDELDRPESEYPEKVRKQTKDLLKDMRRIFQQIVDLVAKFDRSIKESARYMVNADELKVHHAKMKGLQLNFVFMLLVCRPLQGQVVAAAGTAPLGSFEGTLDSFPVTMNSSRDIAGGAPVTYKATLTLRPSAGNAGSAGLFPQPGALPVKPSMTEGLEERMKNRKFKKALANIIRSPFFSMEVPGLGRSGAPDRQNFRSSQPAAAAPPGSSGRQYDEYESVEPERERRKFKEDRRVEVRGGEVKDEEDMEGIGRKARSGRADDIRSYVPSSKEAARDVDAILAHLLGEEGADSSDEDQAIRDEIRRAQDVVESSRARPAQQNLNVARNASRGRSAEDAARPALRGGARSADERPSKKKEKQIYCNGCDKRLQDQPRHVCGKCVDFDYCDDCFVDQEKSHRHDRSQFVTEWST